MNGQVKIYSYPNGEIQRVQWLHLEDWAQLHFLSPEGDPQALECFYDIYKNYHVPAFPWIFENMVLFRLPDDLQIELSMRSTEYGTVSDKLTAAAIVLREGVKIKGGKPVFRTETARVLWEELMKHDCIRVVSGKLPGTKIIPVGSDSGYLSKAALGAQLKVNANFFIMDKFDCATVFDHVGTPFGLCVKEGIVENPPLYQREALLVSKDGNVSVAPLDVRQLEIEIGGKRYCHGKNATVYSRPKYAKAPHDKRLKLVIVGRKIVAVKSGGSVPVPASGYVLCPWEDADNERIMTGDIVLYHGLEEVKFGIQVGNSIVKNGLKTTCFTSPFYNVYHLERVPFPPSLYPMNYEKSKAARIAIGADKDGKPMLLWAEGAAKIGYIPGKDSTGASLSQMAEIAADIGMINAVNLDGGGSAQILLENKRVLRISDRNPADGSDAERLVPLGLAVK